MKENERKTDDVEVLSQTSTHATIIKEHDLKVATVSNYMKYSIYCCISPHFKNKLTGDNEQLVQRLKKTTVGTRFS